MKTREHLKTLLIVVLLFGMVYLAVINWTANNPKSDLFGLLASKDAEEQEGLESPEIDVYPLGISVKNELGRSGAVYDENTADSIYSQTRGLLHDAIKTADRGTVVDENAWRTAITTTPSILYDYQCDVPMSVVSFWMGRSGQEVFGNHRIRYLCLAMIDKTVYLYGKDRAGTVRFCFSTEVEAETFRTQLTAIRPNETRLAAEGAEGIGAEQLLSPMTQVPTLSVTNVSKLLGEEEIDTLLKTLDFNPNTASYHVEQDGTRMYVEDIDTIKILPNGRVEYRNIRGESGYDGGIEVAADGTSTIWEKVEVARELVSALDGLCGSAGRLYLEQVTETEDQVEIIFCREVGGVPLDCGEGGWTARVLIEGNRVTELGFVMRRYEVTNAPCVILPATLAAATMDRNARQEISLRYLDRGAEIAEAAWYLIQP